MNFYTRMRNSIHPGEWRLSRVISILTFPGFLAAAGFWLLRDGFYFSHDVLNSNVALVHIHSSAAFFGYILVPLLFVSVLRFQGVISSIEMPFLRDRRFGYMGAVVGSLMVAMHVQWDATERAGRALNGVEKVLGVKETKDLVAALSLSRGSIDQAMSLVTHELQRYAWVVFLGLLLMYLAVFFGRKLSIHLCGATAVITTLFGSYYRLYRDIPVTELGGKVFNMPFQGWGNDWRWHLIVNTSACGLVLVSLIYWARRKEKAHSHGELMGGMLMGVLVTAIGILL